MFELTLNAWIPILIGIITFTVLGAITLGTLYKWPRIRQTPKVTVIVCARDEEENILDCLMSIATQHYPKDLIQLILVNHLSKDNTGMLMEEFSQNSLFSVQVLHIDQPDVRFKGKIHALKVAMEYVQSEFVMLTDGDCILPEQWIRTLLTYFHDDVVAAGGIVSTGESGIKRTLISRLQNVDHRYYMGIQAGLSGIAGWWDSRFRRGKKRIPWFRPSYCSGNNLAFRKSAYDLAGGYDAVGPTLVEDHALMQRLLKVTGKRLAIVSDNEARVQTTALPGYRALWRQKRRWATASRIFSPLNYLLYLLIFASRVLLPWTLFIFPSEAIFGLAICAFGSFLVIRSVSRITQDRIRLRDIFFHEAYQIVLNHLLAIAFLVRWPVFWKGQRFRNR